MTSILSIIPLFSSYSLYIKSYLAKSESFLLASTIETLCSMTGYIDLTMTTDPQISFAQFFSFPSFCAPTELLVVTAKPLLYLLTVITLLFYCFLLMMSLMSLLDRSQKDSWSSSPTLTLTLFIGLLTILVLPVMFRFVLVRSISKLWDLSPATFA